MVVSIENAEHYLRDGISDEISVIQERVPAGGAEGMHDHAKARQFFYILDGKGTIIVEEDQVMLQQGKGIEIQPRVGYRFRKLSNAQVKFPVIPGPSRRGERVDT